MKAIIEGFKYDTETSTLVTSYRLNERDKGELYRNRKYKFFALHSLFDGSQEDISFKYKIIPLTKDAAMQLLIDTGSIEQYEELFGEIPEAEGEDYIPEAESETLSINESAGNKPDTSSHEEINAVTHTTLRLQRKLTAAVKSNDLKLVKACLVCGAEVRNKHIRFAIVHQEPAMLTALLEQNPPIRNKELDTAVLIGSIELVHILISNSPDLSSRALKTARKYVKSEVLEFVRDNYLL